MGKVGVEITDAAAMEPTAAPAGATMSDITSSTSSASNHKNNLFIRHVYGYFANEWVSLPGQFPGLNSWLKTLAKHLSIHNRIQFLF